MKKLILVAALLASTGLAFAQSTGTGTATGTGTGTASAATGPASSALNYAPVSNYEASTPKPNTVIAPSINPTVSCANTKSGGVAFAGVQIVGGGSGKDEDCADKETIKMVFAMGDAQAAFDITCMKYPDYRESRKRLGRPCVVDTPEYKAQQSALPSDKRDIPPAASVNGYPGDDPFVKARMANK